MPVYRVEGPDGSVTEVQAPEGATQDQVLSFAQQNYKGAARQVSASSTAGTSYKSKYTEAQLAPALRKAHNAGDVPAAKALAREIRRIREAVQGNGVGDTPPLPPGFVLDQAPQGGAMPPLPPGFQLETAPAASQARAPRQGGWENDEIIRAAPRVNPWDEDEIVWDQNQTGSHAPQAINPSEVQWDDTPDDSIARLEAHKARMYAGSGIDQYGRNQEMPIQDMPAVTSRPDFSGVSSRADSTARMARPQEDKARGLKLGVRSSIQGGLGLLGAFGGDAFNEFLVPGQQPTYREMGSQISDRMGLPSPATRNERIVNDVGEGLTGTALTMGAGGLLNAGRNAVGSAVPMARNRLADMLTSQPRLQALSTMMGSGAASATRESGGGTGAQLLAGLSGGLSPGFAAGGAATARGLVRGPSGQTMRENISNFGVAGTTPSVGQASQGRAAQGLESLLSRSPGGAGPMAAKAGQQNEQIGSAVDGLAGSLAFKSDPSRAGRAIERGVTGPGGFLEKFRAKSTVLYNEVDQYLPPGAQVPAANTTQYLNAQAQPIAGASRTSALLANPKLASIREALQEDLTANNGAIPYEALKQVRSKIGEMISDAGLVTDIPTRQLRQLYGSLSDDLKAAAQATGNPKALAAFNRANVHFKAGMDRMEAIESVIGRNGGPEAVFNAALSGTREGATKLRAVMQSLPPEAQKQVSATMIRRLGRALNSQQDDLGEQFSTQTYLTNWNKLSKEAKSTLFGRYGLNFSRDMDKVAKVASNMREGSKVFANPPGTAGATAQWMSVGGLALAAATGQVQIAAGIAGGMAGANAMGRAMTNPRFVAWLARATELPVGLLAAQVQMLRQVAEATDDPALDEVAAQLEAMDRQRLAGGTYGQ